MPNPIRIKLREAGEAIVIQCTGVRLDTSGSWPQLEFQGLDTKSGNAVLIAMPKKSGEQQLERLGLRADVCTGRTLGISRKANPGGKPYWNIAVVEDAPRERAYLPDTDVRSTAPIARTPEPPPLTDADAPPEAVTTPQPTGFLGDPLYLAITHWVLGTVAPLYEQGVIGPTPEALAAMVATVYIQHKRGQ